LKIGHLFCISEGKKCREKQFVNATSPQRDDVQRNTEWYRGILSQTGISGPGYLPLREIAYQWDVKPLLTHSLLLAAFDGPTSKRGEGSGGE